MNRQLPICRCAAVALVALTLAGPIVAAPAPFEKSKPNRPLRPADLSGTWTMTWGGQQGTVTLAPSGSYTCRWAGVTFVGTWKLDAEGRFIVRESATPSDDRTWHSFTVRLDPATLGGRVESGSGVEVRLQRGAVPLASR